MTRQPIPWQPLRRPPQAAPDALRALFPALGLPHYRRLLPASSQAFPPTPFLWPTHAA
jgi:hypothetical protein